MQQLVCQNLSLGYEGKTVVSDLSFSVNAGDYLCIVGENGSGKSTLMKTILKLKTPLSGKVITGDDLLSVEIGYLPQQTAAQKDFPASVREVVRSGCLNRCGLNSGRQYGTARDQRPREALLQRALRRPAAAGASGEGPKRDA
jgi:zinc transport system ATP-binding protein